MPNATLLRSLAAAVLVTACATTHTFRDPIVTDRPDFTESPVPVPTGAVQLESGDTFDRTEGVRSNALGEVLLRVGIAPRTELRVGMNSIVHTLGAGASTAREDGTLGAKVQLVPEHVGRAFLPVTSVLFGTSVPTGSSLVRSRALSPEAKLAMGWELPRGFGLSSNVNVASIPEAGARHAEYVGSLSLDRDLTERVGMYAEWFGARAQGTTGAQYVNSGLTFSLGPNAQLDVRAGAGVGRAHGDYFTGIGIARRW